MCLQLIYESLQPSTFWEIPVYEPWRTRKLPQQARVSCIFQPYLLSMLIWYQGGRFSWSQRLKSRSVSALCIFKPLQSLVQKWRATLLSLRLSQLKQMMPSKVHLQAWWQRKNSRCGSPVLLSSLARIVILPLRRADLRRVTICQSDFNTCVYVSILTFLLCRSPHKSKHTAEVRNAIQTPGKIHRQTDMWVNNDVIFSCIW